MNILQTARSYIPTSAVLADDAYLVSIDGERAALQEGQWVRIIAPFTLPGKELRDSYQVPAGASVKLIRKGNPASCSIIGWIRS